MAPLLWLLRHGEAEAPGGRPDHERPLTPSGEQQARNAGTVLQRLGVALDAVFTSPRLRAHQTAQLASAAVGARPVVHEPLAGEFMLAGAFELLGAARPDGAILLVGHNPDLAHLVGDLTGARAEVGTGALAAVRVHRTSGDLVALLGPAELAALAA